MKIQQDDDDYGFKEVVNKEASPFPILLLGIFAVATAVFMIIALIAIIIAAGVIAMLAIGIATKTF